MQAISSCCPPVTICDKHSCKCDLQFTFSLCIRLGISPDEISWTDKPSGIGRNLKLGWLEGLGELNSVWAMVMENSLEWRMVPSWSMGFMWPWNGHGNRTNRRDLCPFFSISLSLSLSHAQGGSANWIVTCCCLFELYLKTKIILHQPLLANYILLMNLPEVKWQLWHALVQEKESEKLQLSLSFIGFCFAIQFEFDL